MDLSNLEIVDVADIVEEVEEDSEEIRQDDGKKGRGADIHLEEFAHFKDHIEYKKSEVYAEIQEFMSRKSNRPTLVARKEQWVCRFSHKRGFQICKRQYMVAFPHQSMDVIVYHTPDAQHIHEEDPNYFTKENYSWTTAQESIVMQGIRNNVKNTLILRQLKEAGAANGSGLYPNLRQVGVKKRYMKSVKLQTNTIVNVAHLRQYCESNSVPPEDENQFYIPYFYISGEETPNLEITVIWTTLNLISRMSVKMLQDDATYKLNWYQYPVFCCGRSSPTGRFFATHIALSSREDTSAWVRVYAWVKTIFPSIPRFVMADGAPAISKALEEVFGEGTVVRLMCWTHVYRNYRPRLTSVRKVSKELSQKLDMDIHNIQWMCQGQDEFVTVIKLLRDKYLSGSYSKQELDALNDFFEYFITQWCFVTDMKTGEDNVTHVHNWFEGAHPYHPSHNQGLERFNLTIKDDFSYRNQLNMGQFVSVMAEVVEASSVKDASVLDGPRHLILQKDLDGYQEKVSFKIQEEGYKYFNDNLKKLPPNVPGGPELLRPGKQLEINSVNGLDLLVTKLGMDEEVRRVIILPSTNNTLVNKSLKELAITRLQKRKSPAFSTLQEYYNIRTSCHIVEQVGSDFFCDCYHGMKGKLCCHVMGLTYARVPQFPVHPNLSAAKFRRARRPVGRPKKVGLALSKTPPRALPDFTYQVTGMEEREVQVLTLPSLATPEPGPSVAVPSPCVTDSSVNVTGSSVTEPGPSDTVSGPCVTDSSINLPGPSVTVTGTTSRKRKTPSVSAPGSYETDSCVTGPSVKRKTPGNTDTQKELKCRAKYGMEGKEFWCLPCTRKKKCIGTSTKEPVPNTREPVFDTQVSPPSKKARKTRIGL